MRRFTSTFAVTVAATASLSSHALAGSNASPPLPTATIDLRTREGATIAAAHWRFSEAWIIETTNRAPTLDLSPTGPMAPTHDIAPRIGTPEFDNASWIDIDPTSLEQRRTNGRLSFAWYRLDIMIPDHINGFSMTGATAILDLTVDDYAEIWVDGHLPQILGSSGGPLIRGWNSPNRVTLSTNAKPGQHFDIAIFAANGPLSAPPANYIWIRSATLNLYAPGHGMMFPPAAVQAKVTRLDSALDAIIAPDAAFERLADGFSFTEGPIWVPALPSGSTYGGGGSGNYLLFSDPNKNVIHRYDTTTGEVSIFRSSSGYSGNIPGRANIGEYHQPGSNGLTLDPQGRLTICEHGNRRVTRLEPNGTITILADRFDGKRLNSPNDLVYRSDGTLYFTDPPFGLPKVFADPQKELSFSGIYCLHNGVLSLASSELSAPNGLAFSPDEKYLYIDNWDEHQKVVLRYDVATDGTLANPTRLIDLTTSVPGELCFDGLKVDTAGNLYISSPDGLRIYDANAKHLGTVILPELPANFTFGDADGRTLYMCARTGLYRVRLQLPGVHPVMHIPANPQASLTDSAGR